MPSARFLAGFGDTRCSSALAGSPHRRGRLWGEAVVEAHGRHLGHLLSGAARLLRGRCLDLDSDKRAASRRVDVEPVEQLLRRLVEAEVPDRRLCDRAALEQLGRGVRRPGEARVAPRRLALADEQDRRVGPVDRVLEERDGDCDEEPDRGAEQRSGRPREPGAEGHSP
jgi:hypothetical protein